MSTFFPNQRWTSEGEPELGVGIVTEANFGRVNIYFPSSEETRLYAEATNPLRRVLFKPGDTIVDTQKRPMVVERVQDNGELILYIGSGRTMSEADLGDVTVQHGVDDRLLLGDVDTPRTFALRRKTLELDHRRRISPVNGFVGGRIDLIPHQLYIAHEVSTRYAPRVLLSDEVGLGKTIEACLILHRLLLSGRISRVLILVPESLVHQWFVEVLRRFNMWFNIFDEERCAAIEEGAPEGNPFLDDQLIICSTDFLAGSGKRARQALSADWDMLVVDEAHHLEWSVEQASPEYMIVELLSQVAKGLLLLTATPEQLGLESHFARLRLLDPERYADYDDFKNESQDHKAIADVVDKLSGSPNRTLSGAEGRVEDGKALSASDKKFLESLFNKRRVDLLAEGGEAARNNLIEDLLDQHGPGRVVFRNTRAAMQGFPTRKAHLVPLKPDAKKDPLLDWLIATMEKLAPAKVLLICKTKEKVLALDEALRSHTSLNPGVFHEDLNIVQRDRNAAWFAESDGTRLLICSEIGSEGRNFQFAHHLVLYDVPAHPELLEQRIGRLDRIGQTKDIQIHVPYIEGSQEEVLVRWFHEGLNAFEQNLEGGNTISKRFGERLEQALEAAASGAGKSQFEKLIADTAAYQQELKATLANGRDRLLEMNSFRPQVANELVEKIRKEDQDGTLERYMDEVFEHFGVVTEDLAPRSYLLKPSRSNDEAFPGIPDEGISVTFDRKRALSREDVSFISWDHPMATGAVDMVLSSGTGNASFGILRGSGGSAILMEVLFVLETGGGKSIDIDRFLPNTPLRVVVDHTGDEVTDLYPVEEVDPRLIAGQIDDLLDNEVLVETIIPNMITAATSIAGILGAAKISNGLERMRQTTDHEISRLISLQKKNKHIRPEEIQIALDAQEKLAALIGDAHIRLDGLQLIQKG
ncbi:MAG: SNF2-related protein [Bacteroidia bacterium]